MSHHILLIEDESDLVQTLRYRLEKEGYQVSASLTGQGGIALAQGAHPCAHAHGKGT